MSDECSWCGLRAATCVVHNTPTCVVCAESPRVRVANYLERLRRAAKEKAA